MAMVALVLLLSTVSHAQRLPSTGTSTVRVPEPSATVLLLVGLSMIGFGSYCVERRKRKA
jgi:hypothetical protein